MHQLSLAAFGRERGSCCKHTRQPTPPRAGVQVAEESSEPACFSGGPRADVAASICAASAAWRKSQEPAPPTLTDQLLGQLKSDWAALRRRLRGGQGLDLELARDVATGGLCLCLLLLFARAMIPAGLQRGMRTEAANRYLDRVDSGGSSGTGDDLSETPPQEGSARRAAAPRAQVAAPAGTDDPAAEIRAAAAYAAEMRQRQRRQVAEGIASDARADVGEPSAMP